MAKKQRNACFASISKMAEIAFLGKFRGNVSILSSSRWKAPMSDN